MVRPLAQAVERVIDVTVGKLAATAALQDPETLSATNLFTPAGMWSYCL